MVSSETVYKTKKCLVKSGKDMSADGLALAATVLCAEYSSTCRKVLFRIAVGVVAQGCLALSAKRTLEGGVFVGRGIT